MKKSIKEGSMSDIDVMAKEAVSFKDFVKEFYKEFRDFPKNREAMKWLEDTYKSVSEGVESDELERVADGLPQTVEETINEISLSSAGVRDFLRALYRNNKIVKKLGFANFKGVVDYIRGSGGRDWDELRDEATAFGLQFESVNEVSTSFVSGNSGRTVTHLDNKKYQLTKDVKGAQIGNYNNVVLPKGSIIHNLPGGVFVNHEELKTKYKSEKWNDKFGVMIKTMPDTLVTIEKSSKILESVNEAFREGTASHFNAELTKWAKKYNLKFDYKFKEKGKKSIPYFIIHTDVDDMDNKQTIELNKLTRLFHVDYRPIGKTLVVESVNEDHSGDPTDKYVVRPCEHPIEKWAVWEGEVRVKGFETKPEADAFADAKNKEQGITEVDDTIDTITMDVPLFIRTLEFAREDAKTDMDLHDFSQRAIKLTKEKGTIDMSSYNELIGGSSVNESMNPSDIVKDLDKVKNDLLKKVDVLIAKKKKLYSNVDIESPMSADEKKLNKDIADLFSQINTLVLQKRSLKTESVNESAGCGCGCGCGGSTLKENTEPSIISQLKDIVKHNQSKVLVDPKSGKKMRVDLYSASAITQVYDALKQQSNRDKFVGSGLIGMQSMALKLLK